MGDINLELPEVKAAINAEAEKLVEKEVKGLKEKNQELIGEVKDIKKRFEGIDPKEYQELKAAKQQLEDKDGDPVKLRERIENEFKPKLTQAEQERDEARQKLNSTIIDSQLTSALAEAGVAKEFLRAVKADFTSGRKVEVNDDRVVIDGKPVGDFVKAWSAEDGKAFISAGGNSGGGAGGGEGGKPAICKKMSDMTNADKAAFIREHGAQAWADKVATETKAK